MGSLNLRSQPHSLVPGALLTGARGRDHYICEAKWIRWCLGLRSLALAAGVTKSAKPGGLAGANGSARCSGFAGTVQSLCRLCAAVFTAHGQCICRPQSVVVAAPAHCISRPCAVHLQALYSFSWRPWAEYLQALCSVFASSVQCICRPGAV